MKYKPGFRFSACILIPVLLSEFAMIPVNISNSACRTDAGTFVLRCVRPGAMHHSAGRHTLRNGVHVLVHAGTGEPCNRRPSRNQGTAVKTVTAGLELRPAARLHAQRARAGKPRPGKGWTMAYVYWNDELGHSQCSRRRHLGRRPGLWRRRARHDSRPWRQRRPLRRRRQRQALRRRRQRLARGRQGQGRAQRRRRQRLPVGPGRRRRAQRRRQRRLPRRRHRRRHARWRRRQRYRLLLRLGGGRARLASTLRVDRRRQYGRRRRGRYARQYRGPGRLEV